MDQEQSHAGLGLAMNGGWMLAYAVTVAVFAWIAGHMPLMAIPEAAVDDALFVRGARAILAGRWLGPYDDLTLAKGAGFPVWLALLSGLGIPALLGQALFYAGAAVLLVRALSRWLRSEWLLYLLLLVLLANPALYGQETLRIMREGVYTPTLLLIAALILWWFRLDRPRARHVLPLAVALGMSLGFFAITREEGIWLLPFLLACLALRLIVLWRRRAASQWRLEGLGLAVCAVAMAISPLTVTLLNARHYGFRGTVEFRDPAFRAAYGALARLAPDEPSLIVLPNAAMPALFAASPAAMELRPYFAEQHGAAFINVGCTTYGVVPCDGELRAGWFMWGLRGAVTAAGHHASAPAAQAFYRRLADEVNRACARADLICQPGTGSFAPPFHTAHILPTLTAAGRLWTVAAADVNIPKPEALRSVFFDASAERPLAAPFLEMVHAPIYIHYLSYFGADGSSARYQQGAVLTTRTAWLLRRLDQLSRAWAKVGWLFHAAGLLAIIALPLLWRAFPARASWPLLLVCCGAQLIMLSRIALLAYLDTVAIPSVNLLYLSPALPFQLLAGTLGLILLGRTLWPWSAADVADTAHIMAAPALLSRQ